MIPTNKSVIYYLTRKNDLWILRHSIKFLFMNFNKDAGYPVVVIHDDLDQTSISSLMVALHSDLGYVPKINFSKISFQTPKSLDTNPSLYDPPTSQFRLGYRHMCRFMSGLVFNHESLKNYKYCWRLDSDSFILSPINKDPFLEMEKNGYIYAYMDRIEKDEAFVCKGLWDKTQEFMNFNSNMKKIQDWNLEIYYTNFEITDMDFFRSESYQKFFSFLDETNNIYYKRWGDAPIRYLALSMMLDQKDIWAIKDFCYQHGSWIGNPDKLSPKMIPLLPQVYQNILLNSLNKAL